MFIIKLTLNCQSAQKITTVCGGVVQSGRVRSVVVVRRINTILKEHYSGFSSESN